ncbi:MAG: hypothetical protein A3G81_22500 [Betaproteobacteria bacterium RIFCSPLOWO2_12_FULL_65_14]|nr:MAG: hypothetical protein A3G81_22500 [Betaproteobacteria bacterium RIFCSPLOWO2_12_FULL_65_14]
MAREREQKELTTKLFSTAAKLASEALHAAPDVALPPGRLDVRVADVLGAPRVTVVWRVEADGRELTVGDYTLHARGRSN